MQDLGPTVIAPHHPSNSNSFRVLRVGRPMGNHVPSEKRFPFPANIFPRGGRSGSVIRSAGLDEKRGRGPSAGAAPRHRMQALARRQT